MKKTKHDIARVTKSTPRHPSLSAARVAVEKCLQEASSNLSTQVIVARTGVEHSNVTAILQRLRHEGLAVNMGTGNKPAWRVTRKTDATPSNTTRYPTETYTAVELRPFTGRPGAMDAFALPSRGMKV